MDEDTFELSYDIGKPALDAGIVFSCRAGIRSLTAKDIAHKLGYSRFVCGSYMLCLCLHVMSG